LHLFVFTPDPSVDGERSKRDLYSFLVSSGMVFEFLRFKPSGFEKRLKVVGAMVKSYFLVG
jgi:hypothetical protein